MKVIIPIGTGSNWDNNELRYCLRSIEKHAKFDKEIIILGEQGVSIPWLQNCLYKEINRYYPDNLEEMYGVRLFENFFCVLNKIQWYCNQDFCGDEFILFSDDQLLVRDVSDPMEFFNVAFCIDNASKLDKKKRSRHERTILQSLELAHQHKHRNGLSNYETHTPRLYNTRLLKNVFHKYPLETINTPYALATLYYNLFFDNPRAFVKDASCRHVAYFHFDGDSAHHIYPTNKVEIDQASKEYTTFSYNDKGLNSCGMVFRTWIENVYPTKSQYEL